MREQSGESFHYFTHDGETILLEELVRELQLSLEEQGIETDLGPLMILVVAVRDTIEALAEGRLSLNSDPVGDAKLRKAKGLSPRELTSQRLFEHLSLRLRQSRTIVSPTLVREVLREYMRTLERLNVCGVRYY